MTINDILRFRHACKVFDEHKKMSENDLKMILNAGRLAPSSFGLEPWMFAIVNDELKPALKEVCYNQVQVSSCSHLLVILGRLDAVDGSDYLEKCLQRFGENYDLIKNMIVGFRKNLDEQAYKAWIDKQCYIAATHIMIAAASLKIDSCPIEGFIPEKVAKLLKLPDHLFVSLVLPLGYRIKEPRDKERWSLEELMF